MKNLRLTCLALAVLLAATAARADEGMIVGRVLVDPTGLPLAGAQVGLAGQSGGVTTDAEGRYALAAPAGAARVIVQAGGFTSADRSVTVGADAGVAAADARLAPLGPAVAIDAAGGALAASSVAVTVPPGAVSGSTEFRLTLPSAQALPAPLPLGWTPLKQWDLRASGAVGAALDARVSELPAGTLHLVRYDAASHAWVMVQPGLTIDNGVAEVDLAQTGTYAVVVADASPAPPGAGPGQALQGVPAVAAGNGIIGTVSLQPAVVSAAGGTGRATVRVQPPAPLPSGTLFQVRLQDDFTVDGDPVLEEPRIQDVALYRVTPSDGRTLEGVLPARAAHTFPSRLDVSGWIHVELWTRAASLTGTMGGQHAATLQSGSFQLQVAAGSLPHDTLLRLIATSVSSYVPSDASATALGEVVLDLSGETLTAPAELSLAAPSLGPNDVVVIARVERLDGVPYLTVVSLAQVVNGRAVSVAHAALPGIVTGGRYVFYRLAAPVGFVRGVTRTASGPAVAMVRAAGLPFAALSAANGAYTATASAGPAVAITGSIPRSSYQATAPVAVTAGQVSTLDLLLAGAAPTVTVTPADGATGQPVNTAPEIASSSSLSPATVTPQNVKLFVGPPGGPTVAVRFVLSQGNRKLAVIPLSALQPLTLYTLTAAGLRDVYGAAVTVPDARFTTRSSQTPVYDIDKLVFSFPDAGGMVTASAPAGTFAPGSTVMILNYGNQVVLTLTVDNDGAVSGTLPASLDDAMRVSLTDPEGHEQTKNVSRFVDAATGRTAVGAFGGKVEGPGGLEMRLPEGAVTRGVVLKLEAVSPASIPAANRPDLPGATLSSAVRITAEAKPAFNKEVDLVFPKPADAPPGAFYYVFRQLQGPDGTALNQTIDVANVEGDRVVTASPPFSGYVDSIGGYGLEPNGQAAIATTQTNVAILMWTFNEMLPGKASAAVFSGRILRQRWDPGTHAYVNDPVVGALVRRVEQNPERDPVATRQGTVALSGVDGTYTFFDSHFTSGVAKVRATDTARAQTLEATAYAQAAPPWAQAFTALAGANVTFPPVGEPPPAPQVQIKVLVSVNGAWQFAPNNLVVISQPIVLGFAPENGQLQRVEVDGNTVQIRGGGPDYLGLPLVADYTAAQAGVHVSTASLVSPTGPSTTRSIAFLAVAPGGSNNASLPGPPRVLETTPHDEAVSVPPDIVLQVAFSEPVTNIGTGNNINLTEVESGQNVPFSLAGIGPDGPLAVVDSGSIVTGLTLRPLGGLRYSTKYSLRLSDTIVDRDTGQPGDPKRLVTSTTRFKTFGAAGLGGTSERFPSPAIVAFDERAYLVQDMFLSGILRTFDISDPASLKEIESGRNSVAGRPVDIGGLDETLITRGRLVAVGTTATNHSLPSNIQLFDATDDEMERVGVASLTSSAVEGTVVRFVPHGRYLYALTQRQGVQVLDMVKARENYRREAASHWSQMMMDLNTDGRGFGRDAVVRSIPVKQNATTHWILSDIDVGEYQVNNSLQPLALVTGQLPLGVVNATSGAVTYVPLLQTPDASVRLLTGRAIALGHVGATEVAVVVGIGQANGNDAPVLAVVDLTDPLVPRVRGGIALSLGGVGLDGPPTDVLVGDGQVVVAGFRNAVIVSLSDASSPALAGVIPGVAGRIAFAEGRRIVISSGSSGQGGEFQGVRVAALQSAIPIVRLNPPYVVADHEGRTVDDVTVDYRVILPEEGVTTARLNVTDDEGRSFFSGAVPLGPDGAGQLTVPRGQTVTPTPNTIAFEVRRPDGKRSAPLMGGMAFYNPPPTLADLVPARATRSAGSFELTLHGRHFASGATVTFEAEGLSPIQAPASVPTSEELTVNVPSIVASRAGNARVTVSVAGQDSNPLVLHIVEEGLPAVPHLASLEPAEVGAGSPSTWLVVHGSDIQPDDSQVFADGVGAALAARSITPTQMEVLVPAVLLQQSGQLGLRIESFRDRTLTSERRYLRILGSAIEVPPPAILDLEPAALPFIPDEQATQEVVAHGEGLGSGAQLYAAVDGGSPMVLSTVATSSTTLTALLPRALWREHRFQAVLTIDTRLGPRSDVAMDGIFTPGLFLTELRDQDARPVAGILPARFYDYDQGKYLVDPQTAKATATTFERDQFSFRVHVREPRSLTAAEMRVTLLSEAADGSLVDSIPNVDLTKGPTRGLALRRQGFNWFESSKRTVGILDDWDDGKKDAVDPENHQTFRFSGDDNRPNDQTIKVEPGGRLRVVYPTGSGPIPPDAGVSVPVCPDHMRLRVKLKLYRVDLAPITEAEIRDKLEIAKKVWGQMCVVFDVDNTIGVLQDPAPADRVWTRLENPAQGFYSFDQFSLTFVNCEHPAFQTNPPAVCALPPHIRRTTLPGRMALVMSQAMDNLVSSLPVVTDPTLRIVFIEDFRDRQPDGTLKQDPEGLGLTVTSADHFVAIEPTTATLLPISARHDGVIFIASAQLSGVRFDGRTIAHEIAHAIVGDSSGPIGDPFHAYVRDGQGQFLSDEPNLLRSRSVPDESVRRKRFNGAQQDLLYHSRFVLFPPP